MSQLLSLSIIVPIYNEETILAREASYFRELASRGELIFADGQSTDQSAALAAGYGRVVHSPRKGRAIQMNTAAREAAGDILLFLHADTVVDGAGLEMMRHAVRLRKLTGGCFRQVIDHSAWIYRWIAWTGNTRARLSGIFYGDQGIFVRRDIFLNMGGFPELDLCEDVAFTRRLRNEGTVAVLPDPIRASARRWEEQGLLKTFYLNMWITWLALRGKDLAVVVAHYRDVRERKSAPGGI